MLRKTMIVLAKAAALTSGLTVEAFAHGGGRGHSWSAPRMLRVSWLHRHRKPLTVLWAAVPDCAGGQNPCSAAI